MAEDTPDENEKFEVGMSEVSLNDVEPAPRVVCQLGGNRLCNARCISLGKRGGSCKKGTCYCRN
uniref:Defensin n=1 Tax=Ctenocephalides felis TaxID=7515 RepID=A0A0E3GLN1_CTEFE|nr:defensin [Ctenocephalides felis]AKA58494.1 defensin [Ctenocephalides felis]